jgi:hypothetical protein
VINAEKLRKPELEFNGKLMMRRASGASQERTGAGPVHLKANPEASPEIRKRHGGSNRHSLLVIRRNRRLTGLLPFAAIQEAPDGFCPASRTRDINIEEDEDPVTGEPLMATMERSM